MSYDTVQRVAIVGTGVIGAGWAAYFLARGLDVVATDPAPSAESNLRTYIDDAWPALANAGLADGRIVAIRRAATPSTGHPWIHQLIDALHPISCSRI